VACSSQCNQWSKTFGFADVVDKLLMLIATPQVNSYISPHFPKKITNSLLPLFPLQCCGMRKLITHNPAGLKVFVLSAISQGDIDLLVVQKKLSINSNVRDESFYNFGLFES